MVTIPHTHSGVSCNDSAKAIREIRNYNAKKMTDWERAQERYDGAMTAAHCSHEELVKSLKAQRLLGNNDFVKGVNDFFAQHSFAKTFKK
jgi:hypothetical protein